jgi:hypothetical protein
MSTLIKRLWHDPVWSQVIAWGITGVLGAVVVYFWTHSDVWTRLISAIGSALEWLWAPVGVPRLLVGAALLLAMAAVIRAWLGVQRPPAREEEAMFSGPLDDQQRDFLLILLRIYPASTELRVAAATMRTDYAVIEALAERLAQDNLVSIIESLYAGKSVELTKRGRDTCLAHGWNLLL